jgi:hypothetical protein
VTAKTRPLRVAGGAVVSVVLLLESGCGSGRPTSASSSAEPRADASARPSSPFKEKSSSSSSSPSSSQLEAYESARARAWDSTRRFKALFKAEVSPRVGAIGRGWLSVWWDGASGSLQWRASAPIAGAGRGGFLRVKDGESAAAGETAPPLSVRLPAPDLIACILGTRDAPLSADTLLDAAGRVVEMRFPNGEAVVLVPGSGVPRRIEANGPDGRAVLTLETYGPWPAGEEVPPL